MSKFNRWSYEFEKYKLENFKYNEYIYENISKEQMEAIKSYFRWRSRQRFQELVRDTSLQRLPQKALALGKIIGEVDDWVYDGCVDTGYFGGGQCRLGHTLRYEHYALSPSTGYEIVFGIKCASDFFGIEPERLKGMTKVQEEILEEIKFIMFIRNTGRHSEYIEHCYSDLLDLVQVVKDDVDRVFGADWNRQMSSFLRAKLPLTPNMINRIDYVRREIHRNVRILDKVEELKKILISNETKENSDILINSLMGLIKKSNSFAGTVVLNEIMAEDIIEINKNINNWKALLILAVKTEVAFDKILENTGDMQKLGGDQSYLDSLSDLEYNYVQFLRYILTGNILSIREINKNNREIEIDFSNLAREHIKIMSAYLRKIYEALEWIKNEGYTLRDKEHTDNLEYKLQFIRENYHNQNDSYIINIAQDIASKRATMNFRLSEKQRKIVESAYKMLSNKEDVAEYDGDRYEENYEETEEDVISIATGGKLKKAEVRYNEFVGHLIKINRYKDKSAEVPIKDIVFKIVETVTKTKRMSEKQANYLEEALEAIDKFEEKQRENRENEKIERNKRKLAEELEEIQIDEFERVSHIEDSSRDNSESKGFNRVNSVYEISEILGRGDIVIEDITKN